MISIARAGEFITIRFDVHSCRESPAITIHLLGFHPPATHTLAVDVLPVIAATPSRRARVTRPLLIPETPLTVAAKLLIATPREICVARPVIPAISTSIPVAHPFVLLF
jgi:hypothetical protein